jgi:hypothetical protein
MFQKVAFAQLSRFSADLPVGEEIRLSVPGGRHFLHSRYWQFALQGA